MEAQKKKFKIVIFKPIPIFGANENPPSLCTKQWFRPILKPSCHNAYAANRTQLMQRFFKLNRGLEVLTKTSANIYIYNPFEVICPREKKICRSNIGEVAAYKDDNHLSEDGALMLLDDFIHFLQKRELINAGS